MLNMNPISDLVNDDVYNLLESNGLLDQRSVRDYLIKKKFRKMRSENVRSTDAIEKLRREYPYLQFDSIKRIIYKR